MAEFGKLEFIYLFIGSFSFSFLLFSFLLSSFNFFLVLLLIYFLMLTLRNAGLFKIIYFASASASTLAERERRAHIITHLSRRKPP